MGCILSIPYSSVKSSRLDMVVFVSLFSTNYSPLLYSRKHTKFSPPLHIGNLHQTDTTHVSHSITNLSYLPIYYVFQCHLHTYNPPSTTYILPTYTPLTYLLTPLEFLLINTRYLSPLPPSLPPSSLPPSLPSFPLYFP